MILAAIVVCEVGFWVVLAAGLVTRYGLRRPRLGGVLLACVPLVDLALLGFTVIDLRSGAPAEFAHGLAAVYLGFSVVFGHAAVRWADVRAAHRWAGGPPPPRKPASGSRERLRLEWREFARACAAVGISAVLLLAAIAFIGDRSDVGELVAWLVRLGILLLVWLLAWPVWETLRTLLSPSAERSPSR